METETENEFMFLFLFFVAMGLEILLIQFSDVSLTTISLFSVKFYVVPINFTKLRGHFGINNNLSFDYSVCKMSIPMSIIAC